MSGYQFAAVKLILKDIGECSCGDCVKFYLLEYSAVDQLAENNKRRGVPSRGLRQLARENAMTGAINFNLDMRDEDDRFAEMGVVLS